MTKTTVAVAGASGFVGRYLIEALLREGYHVIALSRKDRSQHNRPNLEWIACDLFSRKDTQMALAGCQIAFYLTHSMIPSARLSQGHFADYDLVLADNFARSARVNRLQQVIYLGGIIPDHFSLSRHLLSRLEVERTLAASQVPLTSLRAGIVMGPDGSSFRIMYNLVKRLPVMVCPSWTRTLSNPVSIWDMIDTLIFCTGNHQVFHQYYDIGGKSTLSYFEMMRILGRKLKRKRLLLVVPFVSPALSKLWVRTITGAPKALVYPLVSSLKNHLVPNIHHQLPDYHKTFMTYGQSLDRILAEKEMLKETPNAFRYTGGQSVQDVRSIQRLETLYRFNAQDVAKIYFHWLNAIFPFLRVKQSPTAVDICVKGLTRPLIAMKKNLEASSHDYCVFYIGNGYLSKGEGRGRLIFRNIIDGRNTMVEIHEFVPRLPWFIYKYTQALIHLVTMKMFNQYLLRLQKNVTLDQETPNPPQSTL